MLTGKSILLVISGGIAAYKSLELIRLLRKDGAQVRCILTAGGAQFVTPLSVSALSNNPVYTDLWSLKDESEMGHIRLTREADLVIVAPASANLIAKMANGAADDLASTALLASDKPALIAPAMNHEMWNNPATQANIATLRARGIAQIGPCEGEVACNEYGPGRMAEPEDIRKAALDFFMADRPLRNLHALVTSGPTYEPLDPVRFLGNRSSGKQGHAIAQALADAGAHVTLVTGPVALPDPVGIKTLHVESAEQMLKACEKNNSFDIAVCAAAVSDWSPLKVESRKIKKGSKAAPTLALKENPDILATLSCPGPHRPRLVVGFAAETENLLENARAKRLKKGCDWIVANAVGGSEKGFGANTNQVYLVTPETTEEWPRASKHSIAQKLARRIAEALSATPLKDAAE